MRKYQLTINENQAKILVRVLDFYSRIGMGQFWSLLDRFDIEKNDLLEKSSWELRAELFPRLGTHPGSAWGIHSKEIDDDNRVCWDLQQVIRHRVSWDNEPNGGITVNFDNPMKSSKEPLPEICELLTEEASPWWKKKEWVLKELDKIIRDTSIPFYFPRSLRDNCLIDGRKDQIIEQVWAMKNGLADVPEF